MDETDKEQLIMLLQDLRDEMTKLSIAEIRERISIIEKKLNKNMIKSLLFKPKNESYFPQLRDSIKMMLKKL